MSSLLVKWGIQVSKSPFYSMGPPIGLPHWGATHFSHFCIIFPASNLMHLGQNKLQKL